MSTGAFPPPVPADDENNDGEIVVDEVDGDEVLDEDVNDDLVDSADADRIAAEAEKTD
jgi:hypothetical protein